MNLPNPSRWARALLSAASTFALVLTTSVAVLTPVGRAEALVDGPDRRPGRGPGNRRADEPPRPERGLRPVPADRAARRGYTSIHIATAGTGYGSPTVERQDAPMARSAFAPAAGAGQAGLAPVGPSVPSDFDREGFERLAKMIFIRLQAANDAGDLNDLRQFTTPEFFAAVRLDLQERGASAQQTDVVQIDAEVLDVASEAERQVVSVRFKGLVREASDAAATDFDEVWHLVKPADDSRGWAIAGIQQR
ncbi:Tim44-like domain-containing protein [Piscinibacter sakaiensis]|uniref:Tim44 domain-containing protein n=1 Tax=Piscinibacter sakaiensis TaxID=1547922 RepID=UPI00372ABDDB